MTILCYCRRLGDIMTKLRYWRLLPKQGSFLAAKSAATRKAAYSRNCERIVGPSGQQIEATHNEAETGISYKSSFLLVCAFNYENCPGARRQQRNYIDRPAWATAYCHQIPRLVLYFFVVVFGSFFHNHFNLFPPLELSEQLIAQRLCLSKLWTQGSPTPPGYIYALLDSIPHRARHSHTLVTRRLSSPSNYWLALPTTEDDTQKNTVCFYLDSTPEPPPTGPT